MARLAGHLLGIHVAGVVLLAAATGGWFVAGLRPLLSAKQRAAALGETVGDERDAIRDLAQQRDEAMQSLARLEEELSQTTVRLKPASALNAQLAALTRLAEGEGIAVERIEPGAAAETALATRVPLRLAGRGGSPNAVRFLAALRRNFPDIAVESFEVALLGGSCEAAAPEAATLRFDCVWYADRPVERPPTAAVPTS